MKPNDRIWVAGHRGLVGSAIARRLREAGFTNLLLRTSRELDLRDRAAVDEFVARERPQYVFLTAARVGGILANSTYPADFVYDNLVIQTNVIDAAHRGGVDKLLFLGSSCIYPKHAPQPIREDALLSGPLEPTNEAYAVAKIAGITMCQAYHRQYGAQFISAMPTNLYGPGDNFDLQNGHVLPAFIRRFHEAAEAGAASVTIWGTGTPRREFLYSDDLADACLFLMERYEDPAIINIGVGEDISIRDLAGMVANEVGFDGRIEYDREKPDGTPRKLLDVSRINALGWRARVSLEEGIASTTRWYQEHRHSLQQRETETV